MYIHYLNFIVQAYNMRSLEYGLHCFRKHINGVIEWLVEIIEKLATAYYKIYEIEEIDIEAKRQLLNYISDLAVYRYHLKAIAEESHKKARIITDKEEAIELCVNLIAYLREIRVFLDSISLDLIERGVEEAVYDEIREVIGNCVAAIHHLVDTIESIIKERLEKSQEKEQQKEKLKAKSK